MACQPMSGHHLRFRPSRKCSKLIISAALPPRSRACPAPQIRFDWPTRTLSLRPWRVFQIVITIHYYYYIVIYSKNYTGFLSNNTLIKNSVVLCTKLFKFCKLQNFTIEYRFCLTFCLQDYLIHRFFSSHIFL